VTSCPSFEHQSYFSKIQIRIREEEKPHTKKLRMSQERKNSDFES
jgi:hypothetical protein